MSLNPKASKNQKNLNHRIQQRFENLQYFYKTQIDEVSDKLSELFICRTIQVQKLFQRSEQKFIILENFTGSSLYEKLSNPILQNNV